MKLLLPQNKKQTKMRTIVRTLKQMFMQHSHLAKYLQLMTQTRDHKICRLINDLSYEQPKIDTEMENSFNKMLAKKIRVFQPTEPVMLIWFVFVLLAILYYYVEMGFVLSFGSQVWEDELNSPLCITMDVLTGVIFILDIGVCFNCGYLYRGMVIMDRKRITSHYTRTYLIFDIVSVLVVFACPISSYYSLNYSKFWLLLKIGRLFQIDDFYLRKLNIHRRSKAAYVIFKLMVIIFLLSHLIGLIFYVIDRYLCASGQYQQQFCWLYSSTAYSPIISLDYPLQYMYTLYWGINTITTISYGDIAPMNPIQTVYAIICFCFGFMVYGYVVNQIVKIILWAREHEDEFRGELILMDTYMQKTKITRELRKDIHDYLHFVHREEKNRDIEMEANMIEKIPQELRIELLKNAYESFYDKMLSIFFSTDVIRIFFYLTEKKFTHNESVFNQGERANYLFYILKGRVDFAIKHGTMSTKIYETSHSSNQLIGHYELFINERWVYSAITTKSSLIYSIDKSKLLEEVNSKTKLKQRLHLIESNLLFQKKYTMVLHSCFFCSKDHNFNECPSKFPKFQPKQRIMFQREELHERVSKKKSHTLSLNKQMKNFMNFKNRQNYRLITKVEKRMAKIKRKIDQQNRQFQVDSAYDWEIYYPQFNFFRIRELWNNSLIKNL